jgi:flagellar basal-body rod protein FlgB
MHNLIKGEEWRGFMQFSPIVKALENSLDASTLKQKVIAQNIANVDTPNYKAKQVKFHQEFEKQLTAHKTNDKHIDFNSSNGNGISIIDSQDTSYSHNGNNVDIDREMAEMAKNQLYYQAMVQRLNGKFNSIKLVLRGGR